MTNQVNNQSLIPSTDDLINLIGDTTDVVYLQLTEARNLLSEMTSGKVVWWMVKMTFKI